MTKEADVPTPEPKLCPCGFAVVDHSLAMVQRWGCCGFLLVAVGIAVVTFVRWLLDAVCRG